MSRSFHHLSYEERCQIHALKSSGFFIHKIARQLERSPSTISREIARNSGGRGLNEHTNGLLREYDPKSTDFRTISEASAHTVEERPECRPRKVLTYLTPDEVFATAQTIP